MKHSFKRTTPKTRISSTRSRGFTLIEVMVALAIFAVLMVVVFVPLTQATRFLAVGRTRAELQQSANTTMSQLQRDLSRAIYVYPNDNLPGITDKLPYSATPGTSVPPYRDAMGTPVKNTARIDMLMPELDAGGNVKYPITPAKYIVTYYARRLSVDTTAPIGGPPLPSTNPLANAYSNPVVLIRAQYPYADRSGTPLTTANGTPSARAIDTSNARYSAGADNAWLTQGSTNLYTDESDLSRFCVDNMMPAGSPNPIVTSNHTVVTPRKVALVTPTVGIAAGSPMSPNTTFTCIDTNNDGKIDQVSVSLILTNFNRQVTGDGGNDATKPVADNINFQKFTLNQSFNCPNVR